MDYIQQIEKINQCELPQKYYKLINKEVTELVMEINECWLHNDKEKYLKLSSNIFQQNRKLYGLLFIWLHPISKLQQVKW